MIPILLLHFSILLHVLLISTYSPFIKMVTNYLPLSAITDMYGSEGPSQDTFSQTIGQAIS